MMNAGILMALLTGCVCGVFTTMLIVVIAFAIDGKKNEKGGKE